MPEDVDRSVQAYVKQYQETMNQKFDGKKHATITGTAEWIENALKLPVDKGFASPLQNADGTFRFLPGYDDFGGTIT